MSKTLKHYKKQHNRTRRLSKGRKGGKAYNTAEFDLDQLKREIKNDGRHLFAVHSSKSCGHCKRFKPEWEKVIERLTPHPDLTVANLGSDATDYMNNEHYGKHNYGVNGVPTIVYYVVNKAAPCEYHGKRTADKIIQWLEKTMKEHNLELTIKPKPEENVEQPEEVPESFSDMQSQIGTEEVPEMQEPPVQEQEPPVQEQEPPVQPPVQEDTIADAFPPAPLSPASITETISTKANDLNDTLKSATESATNAVASTVSNIGNKLTNLFSSTPSTPGPETNAPPVAEAPAAPAPVAPAPAPVAPAPAAPAPATEQETTAPLNVPQVPSLVGGIKRRKMTQRKHRKSKSTRKSKKTKKSRK